MEGLISSLLVFILNMNRLNIPLKNRDRQIVFEREANMCLYDKQLKIKKV